jgi:hypothetical protein
MGIFMDLLGTLRSSFRIGKATLSTGALTALRTFSLPDIAGTVYVEGYSANLDAVAGFVGYGIPARIPANWELVSFGVGPDEIPKSWMLGGMAYQSPGQVVITGGRISGLFAPLPEASGGTNQSAYVLGDILYASAANTLNRLAGNATATRKFLRQSGTGSASAAPVWDTLQAGDIPDISGTYQTVLTYGVGPDEIPKNWMFKSGAYQDFTYLDGSAGTTVNLADTASTTVTVTVPGAALTDFALPPSCSSSIAGLQVWAAVTAANTVTVYIRNNTGGTINLGSVTFHVRVMRRIP